MKYDKVIARINAGEISRKDLFNLKLNAEAKFKSGDEDAKFVLGAINQGAPNDLTIVFMGFCPNADFNNRLDIDWKEKKVCRFDYLESEHQLERFRSIMTGDLIVLKKREKFGETMKVYGHGRVSSVAYDEDNIRYLNMDWSTQKEVIEVPLLACNSTVDIKTIETVEDGMPKTFFEWLESE